MADGELNVKTRDDWVTAYKRAARLRNPNAQIGPDEYYDVAAKNLADQLIVISSDARVIAGKISLQDRTGTQLDEVGRPISEGGIGLPRPGAEGASGAIIIQATASGTNVVSGATLKSSVGVSYHVVNSEHLSDGDSCSVVCDENGPQTNLAAGAKLTWDNPPPGCYASATVLEIPGAGGLTGGREEMGDDDYRELLAEAIANPAASANDAELQRLIQRSQDHGVAVEKAFTYSAFLGFGITGFTFTMRGSSDLDSRLPSSAQLNTVAAYVEANMPATDGLVKLPLIVDPINPAFRVSWSSNGWTNSVPWPPYTGSGSRYVVASVSANSISVSKIGGYSGAIAPQAGQVVGLFDQDTGKFRRKTILSVSGSGPWTVFFDNTNTGASDLGYTAVPGQWISPWSDSLNAIAEIVIAHFNGFGPGEATEFPPDDGFRMLRSPRATTLSWPNEMDSRLLGKITALTSVKRATHEDESDHVTLFGSAAAVYLMTIGDIGVFPL